MKPSPFQRRMLTITAAIGLTAVLGGCVFAPQPDHPAGTTSQTTTSSGPAPMQMPPPPGTVTTQTTHSQTSQ